MKIPIFNTIYLNSEKKIKSKKLDINFLNNLDLNKVDQKRYPMIKLLKLLPYRQSLYETVIVSANDKLVEFFLDRKIKFTDIEKKLFKLIKLNEFVKYKKIYPTNVKDILNLNKYVRLKLHKKVYKNTNVKTTD